MCFQASHVAFQMASSLIMYAFSMITIAIFLQIFKEIVKGRLSRKCILQFSLLGLIGNFNILVFVVIGFTVLLRKKFCTEKLILLKKFSGDVNLRIGLGIYIGVFLTLEILGKIYSRDDTQNRLDLIIPNLKAIFNSETPLSPYGNEYPPGTYLVLTNNLVTGIYNWFLPGFVADDNQTPFLWVSTPLLILTLGIMILLISSKYISKNTKLIVLVLLFSSSVYMLATYLGTGYGFAWYHFRYQPLVPFLTMLSTSSLINDIMLVSKNTRIKTFTIANGFLVFATLLNLFNLLNSPRYLQFEVVL
jgi:hypothetical protein